MEKIILTGKETRTELKDKLKEKSIPFNSADKETVLISKVMNYNNSISLEVIKLNGDQYCNHIKAHKGVRFFLNKKYKGVLLTIEEWEKVFLKERLD